MKISNRIIAFVMTVAMLVCMGTFCVSAEEATVPTYTVEQLPVGTFALDGVKEAAYDGAVKIDYIKGVTDNISAEGWLAVDEDALWVLVDVNDATVDEKGTNAWDLDCVEVFADLGSGNRLQYRVDRDGVAYDTGGRTGGDMIVSFTGTAQTKEDGSGYVAEFRIPLPANFSNTISISGFAQDLGSWDYCNMWETNHNDGSTYAQINVVKTAGKAADGAIVLDGKKDYAYNNAAVIEYNEKATIDAIGYLTWDAENLYYFVEIFDYINEKEAGANAWDTENIEVYFNFGTDAGTLRYRIDRDGVLSDVNGKTGDEMGVDFEGAASEMANGNGWNAEFVIPLPEGYSTDIAIEGGFAQDWDVGSWGTQAYVAGSPVSVKLDNTLTATAVDVDSIELDGVKDTAYKGAAVVEYDEKDTIDATGYLTWDADNLYYFVEILDSVNEKEAGANAWDTENIEVYFNFGTDAGTLRYRIDRDGVLSDVNGKTGDEMGVDFEGAASEMADGKGWNAEFVIPLPEGYSTDIILEGGFAQDWDAGSWGTQAYVAGKPVSVKLAQNAAEPNYVVYGDADAITIKKDNMNLLPEEFVPTESADGFTVWFRVSGLKEELVLTAPNTNVTTAHFAPIWVYELDENGEIVVDESGNQVRAKDETNNYIVKKDANGNVIYSDVAEEYQLSSWNHGQDGMRSASWTIAEDGDYLIYVPFKYYSFSHQFTGIDYVTLVKNYNIRALAVSDNNKNATITPMGVFENKVESFNTVLNADGVEETVSGNYTYMNAEFEGNGWTYEDVPGKVGNIKTHEYYDGEGYIKTAYEFDEEGNLVLNEEGKPVTDSDAYDYTRTIQTTWQLAYVNEVLPEKVGEIENPVWFDAPEGGNAMIPYGENALYASAKVSVTFRDEEGNDIEIVTVAPGSAAAPSATPTKESDGYYTYTFDKWVDKDGNAVDLSAVTENTVVYASFTKVFDETIVDDVVWDSWYGEAVKYVMSEELMSGVGEKRFGPDETTTRAMVVTILYRMEGSPAVDELEDHPFTDVEADQWYSDAIKWGYSTKIVNGDTATTFGPTEDITREAFAVIMYRYADEIKGYYVESGRASLGDIADKDDVSDWAINAVKWAIADAEDMDLTGFKYYEKTPLIGGVSVQDGKPVIDPKGNATRAQLAVILQRFLTSVQISK